MSTPLRSLFDLTGRHALVTGSSRGLGLQMAEALGEAGASLLDFTNSGPVAGAAVTQAVSIPVIGGFGGGPWLDGRMRMAHAAIGYAASALESTTENYANVARIALDALTAYAEDVRAGRQIKGAAPK